MMLVDGYRTLPFLLLRLLQLKVSERVFLSAFLYLHVFSVELLAVLFSFICQFAQQYNAQCLGTHTLRTLSIAQVIDTSLPSYSFYAEFTLAQTDRTTRTFAY